MSAFDDLVKRVAALTKIIEDMKTEQESYQRKQKHQLDVLGSQDAWQDSKSDNVQTGFPVTVRLYIPENNKTRHIQEVLLNVWLAAFRSYGTGAASANLGTVSITQNTTGPSATTTSGPSAVTTSGPSAVTTSGPSSAATTAETIHVHPDEWDTVGPTGWADPATHTHHISLHNTFATSHTHDMPHTHDIPSHTHDIPSHTHEIPSHTHAMDHSHSIGSHSHAITHGIYVDAGVASGCTITVNGTDRTTALVGVATFSADQTNLDITQYIVKGLNTISIASTTIGRIDAMVFANVYLDK